jgi:hypothetical protein
VQQRWQEFGECQPIAKAGREQTGGSIDGQGKPVIGITFDVGHQPKELEVAKQEFVLAGVVAVRRQHHLVGPVQHALGLRQIVALKENFRRGRLKGGQHVCLRQIGIQPGAHLFRADVARQFTAECVCHRCERR